MVAFCLVQQRFGIMFVAMTCSPPIHAGFGATAELQELVPMLLHKVQDPADGVLLLFIGLAESSSADMDMQPAGVGLMAAITHLDSPVQDG